MSVLLLREGGVWQGIAEWRDASGDIVRDSIR